MQRQKKKFTQKQIRNRRAKNVTPAEHAIIKKQAAACMRELSKAEYELPELSRWPMKVQTKHRGQSSYGGDSGITIDVRILRRGLRRFTEYRSIGKHPAIGDIPDADPEVCMFALVAHEVAHYVQHRYLDCRGVYERAHGRGWQTLYRRLRTALVNPLVEKPLTDQGSGVKIGSNL